MLLLMSLHSRACEICFESSLDSAVSASSELSVVLGEYVPTRSVVSFVMETEDVCHDLDPDHDHDHAKPHLLQGSSCVYGFDSLLEE